METLQTEIYDHDSDFDVAYKINSIELGNWIDHLKYINRELSNLIGLFQTELNQRLEDDNVLVKFQKKDAENDNLLSALNKYMRSREGIIECEDTQCDMAYIMEHESYRRSYLYHLEKYRRMKDDFFSKVQGKFIIPNMTS